MFACQMWRVRLGSKHFAYQGEFKREYSHSKKSRVVKHLQHGRNLRLISFHSQHQFKILTKIHISKLNLRRKNLHHDNINQSLLRLQCHHRPCKIMRLKTSSRILSKIHNKNRSLQLLEWEHLGKDLLQKSLIM